MQMKMGMVLVVAGGTVVVSGEVVSVAPTAVIVIEHLDVIRALLAAAAVAAVPTVSSAFSVATTIPTVSPDVAVATTIPTVALAIFLLLAHIVGVIIVPPIVPQIDLCRILNLLLHHYLHHFNLLMELRDGACETGVGVTTLCVLL